MDVRVRGCQAAGAGEKLMEVGVDTAVSRALMRRESIYVGGLKFGGFSVFKNVFLLWSFFSLPFLAK